MGRPEIALGISIVALGVAGCFVDLGERVFAECRVAGVRQAGNQHIVQLDRCALLER